MRPSDGVGCARGERALGDIREALETIARILAPAFARAVIDELRAGEAAGMVHQSASALGRRRHIAAVRRRVASGAPGALVIGRRHLLSSEAHDEEMRKLASGSKRRRRKSELLDALGLEETGMQ